jgi:hypothetical protein
VIFEYVSVSSGQVLDVITATGPDDIAYETGRARDVVETLARHTTPELLLGVLGDWSNGYVQLRLVEEE